MKILIKSLITPKTIEIEVDSKDTIGEVKRKIQNKEGIPPDQMILRFGYKTLEDDDKTIEDYKIENGSTIILSLRIRGCNLRTICVNIDGEITQMAICVCGNVKHIKEQIRDKLEIEPESQELSLNGKILDDDNVKTKSLNLIPYALIDLKVKGNLNYDVFKVKYRYKLYQLEDMGFNDENINLQALKLSDGDVNLALELLLNQ
jgi:ubiquitin